MQIHLEYWDDSSTDYRALWENLLQGILEMGTDGSHEPNSTDSAGAAIFMANEQEENILIF